MVAPRKLLSHGPRAADADSKAVVFGTQREIERVALREGVGDREAGRERVTGRGAGTLCRTRRSTAVSSRSSPSTTIPSTRHDSDSDVDSDSDSDFTRVTRAAVRELRRLRLTSRVMPARGPGMPARERASIFRDTDPGKRARTHTAAAAICLSRPGGPGQVLWLGPPAAESVRPRHARGGYGVYPARAACGARVRG